MAHKASWLFGMVLLLSIADVRTAWAARCVMDFKKCAQQAFRADRWWERAILMADCELDFFDCTRRKVLGF